MIAGRGTQLEACQRSADARRRRLRYLTVNKLKMQSKGVASVAARVLNLRERVPSISHDAFCDAAAAAFEAKWESRSASRRRVTPQRPAPRRVRGPSPVCDWTSL